MEITLGRTLPGTYGVDANSVFCVCSSVLVQLGFCGCYEREDKAAYKFSQSNNRYYNNCLLAYVLEEYRKTKA